jgi:radical SAM superfamily enzyme YgiQ (UPF0313 family)
VDALIDSNLNIDRVKENPFELGSLSYIQNERLKSTALEERIRELDDIPSPYVAGLLDKYFDTSLWPILETNRGCPFSCNFCSEGYSYYNKVNKRSNECIKAELNSIAQKHKNQKMMFFADSNFLMFKENLEIAEEIGKLQELYDWPAFVGCSTGKNSQSTVIAGASKLRKSTITLAASVQSLDPEVLENIKRRNISSDGLIDLTQQAGEINQDTYSEVIACLPGDTLEKFKETIKKLIEANLSIIKTHTLLLIHGTELAEPESRKKFGFKTMYRPVSKSFGNYEFLGIKFFAVEAEEIVVGTSSLPHEDYLECRRLQLSVQLFYNDNLFYVNDPWLGQLTYDETELEEIWRERNYFFFEVIKENKEEEIDEHSYSGDVILRPYKEETDALEIFNKLEEVYSKIGWPKEAIWNELQPIDSSLSIVAEVDGNVAGFYFIKEQYIQLLGKEEDEILSNLRGIEGVALGIFNEYKDYGIGKEMIEYPKTIGADYIWGLQLKGLGNIEDWLKRRKLYADVGQMYITYQIFNNNEKNN